MKCTARMVVINLYFVHAINFRPVRLTPLQNPCVGYSACAPEYALTQAASFKQGQCSPRHP